MSEHIEMRIGTQETKGVLFDLTDIYASIIHFFEFFEPLFSPYFFISFYYLHSSTDFNVLHHLDSFYSGDQQGDDRLYYLIQMVLPMDKIRKF